MIVSSRGKKTPVFDHRKINEALARMPGWSGSQRPSLAALAEAAISEDLAHLSGHVGEQSIECDLKALQCRPVESRKFDPALLLSPDGRLAVFVRNDNLWVRDVATGSERRLTDDGAPDLSWGKWLEGALARKLAGSVVPPFGTSWSPDSRYLISMRVDQRAVPVYPFVQWVPADGARRPVVHEIHRAFAGDPEPEYAYFWFDVTTGRSGPISFPGPYDRAYCGWAGGPSMFGWSRRHAQAFLLVRSADWKTAAVFRLDLASTQLTKVVEESAATRFEFNSNVFNAPNIRLLGDGDEILWYSDRTGWGHLYLYDAQTGRLKRAVTDGDWSVHDILRVDERRREVYFTAAGRERGRDPYYRHLYRTGLDRGSAIHLLTEPNADHHFTPLPDPNIFFPISKSKRDPQISPRADVFIDTWSTVEQPPITALRSSRDGHLIQELERADASRLYAEGWKAPIREKVKAADGVTDLYVVYYATQKPQADEKHPVVDVAYGGPNEVLVPRNFTDAWNCFQPRCRSPLTRLGIAAVTVDGRGTAMRSRAFRDAGYPEFTRVGIEDHIAAIRELSRRHPEMDLTRVGVSGNSWGGTFAAQAILSHPEFYQVAVSGEGVYDYAAGIYDEPFIGPIVYAHGTRDRAGAGDLPLSWDKVDITRMASRLTGHLLMFYSDLDENVPPVQVFRMLDALKRANKPYDLLYLPNRNHASGVGDAYTVKRTWDYFVEHLLGRTPPLDFSVELRPFGSTH